ncbi:MAG: tRNA (adenosine(37)-N6)-threonylcarbamoyltransferase complex ATPase subunit type 1 TsaE [Burkholderiales bacterium]|nr:tRNA (adenosine(37)-N6)-threonylcarbamoyltransferase complex ATPase subunit type 1 TsaE [Burkholderiales bacterium]
MPATWHLPDAAATEAVGAALATALAGGMVVALHGDLGTGKTTLVRGVLRALGWTGPVKSPTYALVESYVFSRLYLYHFDFYRFTDPEEWETAGLAECFRSDSACLVEWPERVSGLLPVADLDLRLAHAGDGRSLTASASTDAGERCVAAIALTQLPAC